MSIESPWILVVDDDDDVREMLCLVLQTRGFHARDARNREDALALIVSLGAPALVLLDLRIPNEHLTTDNDQFGQQLQLAAGGKLVPFVLVSGDQDVKARAKQMGASHALMKPVATASLIDTVRRFVQTDALRPASTA